MCIIDTIFYFLFFLGLSHSVSVCSFSSYKRRYLINLYYSGWCVRTIMNYFNYIKWFFYIIRNKHKLYNSLWSNVKVSFPLAYHESTMEFGGTQMHAPSKLISDVNVMSPKLSVITTSPVEPTDVIIRSVSGEVVASRHPDQGALWETAGIRYRETTDYVVRTSEMAICGVSWGSSHSGVVGTGGGCNVPTTNSYRRIAA